jgi:hypothetical protein
MLTVKDAREAAREARKARVNANRVYQAAIKARNNANNSGDSPLYCELADMAWRAYLNRKTARIAAREAERVAKQAERRTSSAL